MNPTSDSDLTQIEALGSTLHEWLSIWSDVGLAYQTDLAGNITHISPSVTRLLGYKPEELIGQPFDRYFGISEPVSSSHISRYSSPCGDSAGSPISVVRKADGEHAYMDIREREFADEEGTIVGREGIAYDLTSYMISRMSLERSEAKYRRLVEGLGGDYAIYTHAPDGTLTYVSPSVEQILGYKPEHLVGHNWRELIGEDFIGRERADQVRREVDAGIDFHKFCVEVERADGTRRLLEVQQRPEFNDSGVYYSMEGIAKDITEATRNAQELQRLKGELEERVERRTAELASSYLRLAESEARYRTVIEDQTEFVCRFVPGGNFTFVNDAYCRYRKLGSEQLIGTSCFANVHEEDLPQVQAGIARLSGGDSSYSSEHRVLSEEGSVRWNHWTIRALYDKNGACFEYQTVGRDVTELRVAEERIQEREDHLKRVSRLVTMGELISGIAHEIHQPLHAAQLFAEAARRNLEAGGHKDIETAIDCTREVTAAILRTATIIRHLRSFTTAKSSTAESLDLNEVLDEVNEILCYEIRKAGVQVEFHKEQDLPVVRAARVQLQQVIVHFYRNAIEAMADNEPDDRRLVITTRHEGEFVEVQAADNGKGTQEVDVERLFDAFHSTKPGRLGMGLSICRTIAESHQGLLHAWNNRSRGMTFSLRLPQAKKE